MGIAIVGPHRSGTSAVAGVVYHLGAFMGNNLYEPSNWNERGYFEDKDIVAIHDAMIGGKWWKPMVPSVNIAMNKLYAEELHKFRKHELWAIKDPRLCYTLLRLKEHEPGVKVITVHRDPWFAARSLSSRDRFHFKDSLEITLQYEANMLIRTKGGDNVLRVRYIDLLKHTEVEVERIADFIGADITKEALEFVDPNLSHHEYVERRM